MPRTTRFERELIFRTADFQLDVATWENHPDYPMITNDFCEIAIVLRGTATKVAGKPEREFPLKAGDVFALQGGVPHGYRDTRDLTVVNIIYDRGLLDSVKFDVANLPGYRDLFHLEPGAPAERTYQIMHLEMEQLEQVRTLTQAIEKELHPGHSRRRAVRYQDRRQTAVSMSDAPPRDRGCQFMAMAQFMVLVGMLSRWRFFKPTLVSEKVMNIGRAISHMERSYHAPLDPVSLAKMLGMSYRNFYRTFQTVTEQTPAAYLQRLRLTKAAHFLQTTDRTVTDIAFQCGFDDSSYFARCFRQRFGVSPRRFKPMPG
ncbi:MAG: AraC family transcriptional regulator [Akkermansiaceae bacterium]|nr:AraC family transcriptional regulator [Akkermansiaceae bacterium]